MHIKSNIELNVVHFAVLAICPLLLVATNAVQAMLYILLTAISFFLAVFLCYIFNKYLSVPVKIFITALLASFVVTIANFILEKSNSALVQAGSVNFYAALSTVILSIDTFYVNTKASSKHYLAKLLNSIVSFAVLLMAYVILTEILGYGTFFGKSIKNFGGIEFFRSITFGLLWLGLICAFAELVYRYINAKQKERKLTYQKFLKQIRNEKAFQYDKLRREKLLTNPIEVNSIGGEKAEEENEKSNDNIIDVEDKKEETEEEPKTAIRKKNRRFKASHETKVEKVFDRQHREDK